VASIDFDSELRAAVFAHVANLRDRYGGRIPSKALREGVLFRHERVPLWNYQKGIFKPRLLGRDGAALSIQTSAGSPYADEVDIDAARFIYKYRGTDASHADNVALRAAMQWQRPLLYLVAVDPGVYDAVFPVYVVGDDPRRLQFTLVADQVSGRVGEGESDPLVTSARRAYATRAVMQRLHQQQFRWLVLRAYNQRCAICRLGHVELLDAAHILADRDPRGEPVVTNGIGLCKIHHCAYDTDMLGIDADARVHIRRDVLEEQDGPMLRHGLQELNDARLILPSRRALRPNRDFLAERFRRFRAA
jgi:putative restriction endonuclease